MSNTGRVKCRVCLNEDSGFCSVKKCNTKGNKARVCGDFVNDFSKVKIKEKVPTTMRPDWYWKRKEVRRAYKEFLKKQEAEEQLSGNISKLENTPTSVPDCLANFRSTASDTNSGDIDIANSPESLANLREAISKVTASGAEEKNEQ